jgi:hypothetical protein
MQGSCFSMHPSSVPRSKIGLPHHPSVLGAVDGSSLADSFPDHGRIVRPRRFRITPVAFSVSHGQVNNRSRKTGSPTSFSKAPGTPESPKSHFARLVARLIPRTEVPCHAE